MNYHHSTQTYFRQRSTPVFQQQLYQQRVSSLPGDKKVWLAVRKVLLVLCPLFLALHLLLAGVFNDFQQSVQAVENIRHNLLEKKANLRVKRDQLFSPEHVRILAVEKLSLDVPEKEQIKML